MEIPYIQVDNFKFEIDEVDISYEFADLSTEYTGRSEISGKMVKDNINQIYNITINFGEKPINENFINKLKNSAKDKNKIFFKIKLPVMGEIGITELTVYSGNFTGEYAYWENGVNYYKNVQVAFVEQ